MGVIKKYLIATVSLLITIGLLLVGITLFKKAQAIASNVTQDQTEAERVTAEYGITKYDGYEIVGSAAIAYIKDVNNRYGLPVEVTTAKKIFVSSGDTYHSEFRNINSDYYINPMAQYSVTIERDQNGAISKVSVKYVP